MAKKARKRIGRPPKPISERRPVVLKIRMSKPELSGLKRSAKKANANLSNFVRDKLGLDESERTDRENS